jgi:hypothetical protein
MFSSLTPLSESSRRKKIYSRRVEKEEKMRECERERKKER